MEGWVEAHLDELRLKLQSVESQLKDANKTIRDMTGALQYASANDAYEIGRDYLQQKDGDDR